MIAARELVVDNFAGGGGASTGIEAALGRPVDIAVNHSAEAIAMHEVNHPRTRHYRQDIWEVDPREVCRRRPVGLAWFSPDCRHFSRAKGGKPKSKRVRSLAWVVVRWAAAVRPRVIILENVQEFETWGPLDENDKPIKARSGETFDEWVAQLEFLGYAVEWRALVAADYGTPTTRKRLFLVARCDGEPIVWPEPTHGAGRAQPWLPASGIIDWTLPCPSIFERKRPLADATLRRISAGVMRYVIDTNEPFIVTMRGTSPAQIAGSARSMSEPIGTVSAGGIHHALVAPTLVQTGYGERKGQAPRALDIQAPLGTVVAGGSKHGLVAALLSKHYGGVVGHCVRRPIGTVTAQDHHALTTATLSRSPGGHADRVHALLMKYYGTGSGQDMRQPLHTVTTKDRFGLVLVRGELWRLEDIGMRMLQPHELFAAQGFPVDYIINFEFNGKPLPKKAQNALVGRSVCPPLAEAMVRAQLGLEWPVARAA